jgi:hypothetical protein
MDVINKGSNFKEYRLEIIFFLLLIIFYIFLWVDLVDSFYALKYLFEAERGSTDVVKYIKQLYLFLFPFFFVLALRKNKIGIYSLIFIVLLCFSEFLLLFIFFLIEGNFRFSTRIKEPTFYFNLIGMILLIVGFIFTKILPRYSVKKNQLVLPIFIAFTLVLLQIPVISIFYILFSSIVCFIVLLNDENRISNGKRENFHLSKYDFFRIKRNLLLLPFLVIPAYFFLILPLLQGDASLMSDRMFDSYYYPNANDYTELITILFIFFPALFAFISFHQLSLKNSDLLPYSTNFFLTLFINYVIFFIIFIVILFIIELF